MTIKIIGEGGVEIEPTEGMLAALIVEPVVRIPQSVSRAQAKIALLRAGKLEAVKTAVEAAGGEVEIWFADSLTWHRRNQHVIDLGVGIGLTPEEIDELFIAADQIAA